MFLLLLRAALKFATGATPLNKGEHDQPPSDGVTFQKDHVEDAWAWGRNGKRVFKNAGQESMAKEKRDRKE